MDRLTWKAKIGLVVVSSSTVCEGRYPRVAPPDVGFFTSRMLLKDGGLAAMEAMEAHAARAVEELASVPVDAIAVQQHYLQISTLTGCALTAADVNEDSQVNTVDVVSIQRFFIGRTFGTAKPHRRLDREQNDCVGRLSCARVCSGIPDGTFGNRAARAGCLL